jgi:hypothetical protein
VPQLPAEQVLPTLGHVEPEGTQSRFTQQPVPQPFAAQHASPAAPHTSQVPPPLQIAPLLHVLPAQHWIPGAPQGPASPPLLLLVLPPLLLAAPLLLVEASSPPPPPPPLVPLLPHAIARPIAAASAAPTL